MIFRRCVMGAAAVAWVLSRSPATLGGDQPKPSSWPMPTLGGKQFWADELFLHQWRIQRHALTGHCRLLDGADRRFASGSFDHCRAVLDSIRRREHWPPMEAEAVILLHGLFRSRSSMDRLARYLRQQGGYQVFNVGYPSTQRSVGGHARALARIIENLDGIERIHFVAHSMGNIVVRRYLAMAAASRPPERRFGRFVMLGPPNHGSLAAQAFSENAIFQVFSGESGLQLGEKWGELEDHLATPEFPFGIIAGGKGDQKGYNPLLPGDDDGTISVASTRLAGAEDFIVVATLHSGMMNHPQVQQYTLRFLQHGYFVSAERRQPLPPP